MGLTLEDSNFTGWSNSLGTHTFKTPPRGVRRAVSISLKRSPRAVIPCLIPRPAATMFGNLYNAQILGSRPDMWNKNSRVLPRKLCYNSFPVDSIAYSSLRLTLPEPQYSLHAGGRGEGEFKEAHLLLNYLGLAMTSHGLLTISSHVGLARGREDWDLGPSLSSLFLP